MGEAAMRVLVVDDNRDFADNLVEVLDLEGHQAVAAYSGTDALQRVEGFDYDAAVVDIRMPDMSGVALVRRLMRERADRRYILMTAYSHADTVAEAMAISQHAVLDKPLDMPRLLRLVGPPHA